MGKIIAISNQKGGVGKSTTAINLSAALTEKLQKVLVIDMDPQGNTTGGLGIDRNAVQYTVYDLLLGEAEPKQCIQKTPFGKLRVIPSNVDLAGAEIELLGFENREFLLRNKIESLKKKYHYIFIDCPPSLSVLTLNALCAADSVLIPVQCEYYALEGLTQLMKTISLVRERLNPDLVIEGIVFTMYDGRTNLSSDVVQNVKDNLDVTVFDTMIPRNVRLAESPSYGLPVTKYDPKSTGAQSYRELAKELMKRGKNT